MTKIVLVTKYHLCTSVSYFMDETSVASPVLCCHDYFHRFSNALFGELYNTAADIATCSNMKEKTLKEKKLGTVIFFLFSFTLIWIGSWSKKLIFPTCPSVLDIYLLLKFVNYNKWNRQLLGKIGIVTTYRYIYF